jgi:hypothetical protein
MFGDMVFAMNDADEIGELLRSAGFSNPKVNWQLKSLDVPPPVDFLWQYIHSTPLVADVFGKAGPAERAALEKDVCADWRRFETKDGMRFEVGMTTASARK